MLTPLGRWRDRLRHRRARRDDRGAVLILGAVFAGIAVLGAALAVDIGRIVQDKRNDQRVADLVALDAVRGLQDQSGANRRTLVNAIAADSALRNGFDPAAPGNAMAVELGVIAPGTTTFVAIPPGNPAADETANAVRVELSSTVPFFFAAGSRTVRASAVARLTGGPIGTVRVGSTLVAADFDSAALGPLYATILNRFLNRTLAAAGLPAGSLSLSAVGWKGIAAASVTLDELAAALGVGSPAQALSTQVTYAELVRASALALSARGDPSQAQAVTALGTIATQFELAAGMVLRLGDLVHVAGDVGNGTDVADVALSVMDLVRAGAMVANGTHFVGFDLGTGDLPVIPGVQSVNVRASLIEAPQQAVGPAGTDGAGAYLTEARTAQVALSITARIGLSLPVLGSVTAEVPFLVQGGEGRAGLDQIECSVASRPDRVDIGASTSALTAKLAAVSNGNLNGVPNPPTSPATILDVNVLGIRVTATVTGDVTSSVPGAGPRLLEFDPPYVDPGTPQTLAATGLTFPTLAPGNLTINVSNALVLNVGTVAGALVSAVNAAVPGLSTGVLAPVAKALGVSYAGADVWAPPVQKCDPTHFAGNPTALSLPTLVG